MYKVGVIGVGAIAAMYETPESKYPYCHVGGIRLSNKVSLAAVADISESAIHNFKSVWGGTFPEIAYYSNSNQMLDREQLDIVSVCVRGPYHFQVVMEVIEAGPKVIFLEKPPSCSLQEMDQMVEYAAKKNIPIVVSYSRHWNPHILRLQQLVREGLIGEVQTVVGYCGEQVLSFSSHTTDLICQFAGYHANAVYAHGTVYETAPEGYEPEPSLDNMIIEFRNGIVGIQVGASGEHGSMYAEIFGTEGMLRVGMYIPTKLIKDDKLVDLAQYGIPENSSVFTVAYDQIADYLDGGPLPDCTNADFIAVNEIGFAAIESMNTSARVTIPVHNRSRKIFANG